MGSQLIGQRPDEFSAPSMAPKQTLTLGAGTVGNSVGVPGARRYGGPSYTTNTNATSQQQADALASPGPVTADTQVNPLQQEAYDASKRYSSQLEEGNAAEITRAMQRGRDEISTGMRAEGEAAMGRGADPTLFRTRRLAQGQRDLNDLEGRLTDVALGRRAEANRDLTSAAGGAASEQRQMHLGSLSAQIDAQRNLDSAAEAQARLYQAPYERLLDMMKTIQSGGGGGGGIFDNVGSGPFGPVIGSVRAMGGVNPGGIGPFSANMSSILS